MDTLKSWCVAMPKVELHAHLNGCIRDSTITELARHLDAEGIIAFSEFEQAISNSDRSLHEVFKLFDLIRIMTTDHKTLTRIAKEVVEDFAADNVLYVELRTTPKENKTVGMTKRSYMDAVIDGLRAVDTLDVDFPFSHVEARRKMGFVDVKDNCRGASRRKIYVRLLLSIDRREPTASAMETVRLASEMRDEGVVGIDLSGNPAVGEWTTFLPALRYAREQGLRITLHCGEVPNQQEIHSMLDFRPERIGHACYLEEEAWTKLKASDIPVEICMTSNVRTTTVAAFDVHHFADLYNAKHPIMLCTDDTGIFSTTLSREFSIAAATFGLGRKKLFQLATDSIKFIFAENRVVQELTELFDAAAEGYVN